MVGYSPLAGVFWLSSDRNLLHWCVRCGGARICNFDGRKGGSRGELQRRRRGIGSGGTESGFESTGEVRPRSEEIVI
ncbi:hypothetical protein Ccrd_017806 [Cynara cardunculus var. scolymus]|uniref:Uncharacterized protein n=1 Tax=Cynara cardunculus var. scolymus TaxID=59895 RepID=A0A124SFP6_CYNCS|nr:hypothetical protein Ccrd_017806 [Cynara cardunculus var. scolymus]